MKKQTQSCLAPSTAGRLNQFEKTKPICSFGVLRTAYCVSGFEKTKPIYSYCVLRDAYCDDEFEKTNPILGVLN
jgi:hypothetical protein